MDIKKFTAEILPNVVELNRYCMGLSTEEYEKFKTEWLAYADEQKRCRDLVLHFVHCILDMVEHYRLIYARTVEDSEVARVLRIYRIMDTYGCDMDCAEQLLSDEEIENDES